MQKNEFNKIIAKDLYKIKKNIIDKKNVFKFNNMMGKKKIKNKNVKKNTRITSSNIAMYKIKGNNKLTGKYLIKYNNFMYNNKYFNILYYDLIKSNYYLYDYMIKQKLSIYGLNRTRQLYGTCWLDSLINGFIFGKYIRNHFLKLLDYYIKINKITNIKKFIKQYSTTKLNTNIDKTDKKIFFRFISILYQVLCDKGMRNKVENVHDNFIVTNFALNVRNIGKYNTNKITIGTLDDNIAYNPYYALEYILNIFNMNLDKKISLTYEINNSNNKIYNYNNVNKINVLYLTISKDIHVLSTGYNNYINVKNISIKMDNTKKVLQFNDGVDMGNMDNINFLIFSCRNKNDPLYKIIPKEIECTVNNKKYLFKLDSGSISIMNKNNNGGHSVTGIICDKSYYIYDPYNNYFEVDWTDLSPNNIKYVLDYYRILRGKTVSGIKDDNTNKYIIYTDIKENSANINIEYAIYYNTNLSPSYKMKGCNPSR